MIRVMNLRRTSLKEVVDPVLWLTPGRSGIQVKEGGTSLNKTFREYNLVTEGLTYVSKYENFLLVVLTNNVWMKICGQL